MARMNETELKILLQAELDNCVGLPGGKLSEARRDAMRAYEGLPYGNEVDGRSQVVLRDVQECVENIMPDMMRIFCSGDEVVRFEPQRPESTEKAQQATDYVNYIFNRQNDGPIILHDWFKDALIQRLGVVKAWWDEREETSVECYEGLTQDQLLKLFTDFQAKGWEVEILDLETVPDASSAEETAP